ncbi:hypothetical protein [Halobellus sp. H-GB7]|uniref:hypothetical protein n=1 Tax=Halobellus sp. H-GB7 TaxID=3069756 RepID=UPI0027B51E31|nr:hypothetical protein [Halobellus sp. H-GB7]MDQ2053919.1 hypothetical protein [Halobellus sp. H-GB7]
MPADEPSSSSPSSSPSRSGTEQSSYPDTSPLSPRMEALLLGRDPDTAVRLSAVAGTLFAVTFVLHLPPRLVGWLSFPFGLFLPLLVGTAFLAAAVGAYRNDGFFVALSLAGGPSFGFYFPLGLFELTYPSATVLEGLTIGATVTVAAGTAGFLVGAGGRRAIRRIRD